MSPRVLTFRGETLARFSENEIDCKINQCQAAGFGPLQELERAFGNWVGDVCVFTYLPQPANAHSFSYPASLLGAVLLFSNGLLS